MTLVRVLALSILLGSALAGIVWFTWGAIGSAFKGNKSAAETSDPKDAAKEKAAAKKPA